VGRSVGSVRSLSILASGSGGRRILIKNRLKPSETAKKQSLGPKRSSPRSAGRGRGTDRLKIAQNGNRLEAGYGLRSFGYANYYFLLRTAIRCVYDYEGHTCEGVYDYTGYSLIYDTHHPHTIYRTSYRMTTLYD
jgi:hypothetical protein